MNHRDHIQAYKAKTAPPEYDDRVLQLLECIRSGQVSAAQEDAHFQAGDLNQGESDGRNKED